MQIDKHISSLLFEHDCVIVPGLGGFVSNYTSAGIHPTQHVFSPPRKIITFNKHLKMNDGLLANQVARSENKTYAEANSIINSFVSESNNTLKKGEKVMLFQVGSLYMDVERNTHFDPDHSVNYLTEAFGMNNIQSLPIKREGLQDRIEKEFTDRKAIPLENGKSKSLSRIPAILSVVVVLLAASIIFLADKDIVFKKLNFSSLNPFSEKIKPVAKEPTLIKVTPEERKNLTEEKKNAIEEKKNVTEEKRNISENIPFESTQPDKTDVSKNDVKPATNLKYHVISGCFKIRSNAVNFLEEMKNKNFKATIIGQNREGLFIVSCGDYALKEDAYAELARLRSQQTQAWVLAK
jgi:cell division septation protein DedD